MIRPLCFACALALVAGAWAVTYNTINLTDGGLADWDPDEVLPDFVGDEGWGVNNDLQSLLITWDATRLYVGGNWAVDTNAFLLYLDLGFSGGETDFNSGNGYTGAWPRNITFSTVDIDLFLGSWDGAAPGLYSVVDNVSTDITASAEIQSGGTSPQYWCEVGVDWDVLYGLGAGTVPTDTQISIVGCIMGGDNWGGPDSAPDNPDFDGDGGPDDVANLFTFTVDGDSDGAPDAGVVIPVELSVFTAD